MSAPMILLHEEALRPTHPVFSAAPVGTQAVYVWDNDYFQRANYSLKRLVFIYETLCELPVDIIRGTTIEVVREIAPTMLYVPVTNHPLIASTIAALNAVAPVEMVDDDVFVMFKKPTEFRRFFQYWNKAEKTAFQHNGGGNH